jgi:hypothetical protein
LFSTVNAVCAQQAFQLKAQLTDKVQLSRAELEVAAAAPAPAPTVALAPRTAMAAPTVNPVANRAPEEPDRSYLQEYSVDWRGWLAKFADRWYYLLRVHEEQFDAEFVTARPALFQFTCYSNGAIGNLSLRQSSGNPVYDRLQMVALMEAAPLPPFPTGTRRTNISLVQGWESHVKQPGESGYVPGSFGSGFPLEKVKQWVKANY